MATSTTQNDTPKSVQELSASAHAVYDAQQAMQNNKDKWAKVARVVREIDTCVSNTAKTAYHRGERVGQPVVVVAALGATGDVLLECAKFMNKAAAEGAFTRFIQKASTADAAAGYLSMVQGLQDLLKAWNNECGLMINPAADFGAIVQPVKIQKGKAGTKADSTTLPDISKPWSKDDIDANITKVGAAYDGLKSALNVMVNITDGLPWPLKAAPQTLLYILQLFENFQDVLPKLTSLLYSVQKMWKVLEKIAKGVRMEGGDLKICIEEFLETLWRIVIRLHMVMHAGWAKRALAVHSVSACLEVERQRIKQAQKDISLTFQGELLVRADEHDQKLSQVCAKLEDLRLGEMPTLLISNINMSRTLPARSEIFNGRDDLVSDAVGLLLNAGTTRLAVLGAGGMGKTSVAVAIIHDNRIIGHFGDERLFLSCEALSDADSIVVALATLLDVKPSNDLLSTVISHLKTCPRTLVFDNIETVWLVDDATKASAVEDLLAVLAKAPKLSFIITCRGSVLPPPVRWSNKATATLAPFSPEAAMETFEDTADVKLVGEDRSIAERLLHEVDRMPLAVTLLGQLAGRGIEISELLDRWNRTHTALLRTRTDGRKYNIDASIYITIELLRAATTSPEPLQLLAICSLLPAGLRPPIFQELRKHFNDIDGARQALRDYALISVGVDGESRMLSPIRHFVLARYPPTQEHHAALRSIYFELLRNSDSGMDEGFKRRTAAVIPELGNLASLLLTLVHEPSNEIVEAVFDFTQLSYWLRPTVTVACTLLPHLEQHPQWKADCLYLIAKSQIRLGNSESALTSLSTATELYFKIGNRAEAAMCMMLTGETQRHLGQVDSAKNLAKGALEIQIELGNRSSEGLCRFILGILLKESEEYSTAVLELTEARQILGSLNESFGAAQCSEMLGNVYLDLDDLDSATAEFEAARLVFATVGDDNQLSRCTRSLAETQRKQGNLTLADKLLEEVEVYYKAHGDPDGLALHAVEVGYLRGDQGRREEAIACFGSALGYVEDCTPARSAGFKQQIADALIEFGEIDKAEELLNDTLGIYAELHDEMRKAKCRRSLAGIMQTKEEYSVAIEHLTAARQSFTSFNSSYDAASCSNELGDIYLNLEDFDSAATEFEAARSVFITLSDQSDFARCTSSLALTRHKQGNLTLARRLLEEVEAYYKTHGGPDDLAQHAVDVEHLRNDQRRQEKAITGSESALGDVEGGNPAIVASGKRLVAEALIEFGRIDEAEGLLNDALEIYVELKDESGKANCRRSLAGVMQRKKEYSVAIEHLTAARQAFTSLDASHDAAMCSDDLANVYLDFEDFDSAATEFEAARLVFIALSDQSNIARCTRSLASTRRLQGDLALADQLLGEVDAYNKEHGSQDDLASHAMEVGYLRQDQERLEDAVACFELALQIFEALGQENMAEECREELELLKTEN